MPPDDEDDETTILSEPSEEDVQRAYDAATPDERARATRTLADLIAEDEADPNTASGFDVTIAELEGSELEAESGGGESGGPRFAMGSPSNVASMKKVAALLKTWGWTVNAMPGWETRGTSSVLVPTVAGCHHTGAAVDVDRILRDGRPGLSGPLCNFAVHRDGTVVLVAAGTANHFGVATISNNRAYGIETTGPIPAGAYGPQAFPNYKAYSALVVAIRKVHGWPVSRIVAHKEVALPKGRKPDPAFDMNDFRRAANVARVLKSGGAAPPEEDDVDPKEIEAAVERVLKRRPAPKSPTLWESIVKIGDILAEVKGLRAEVNSLKAKVGT